MKGKYWRNLRNWYDRMSCCVSVNGAISSMFPVRQGVRQGSVLSPWLFMCYNNDIPNELASTREGIIISDMKCSTVIVADDITLMSFRVKGLQKPIDSMQNYCSKWRFEFNSSKTIAVTFGESTQTHKVKKLTLCFIMFTERSIP